MAVQAVFVPVTEERGIRQAAVLAEEIWQEHYADILTPEQVRYMVDRFQSSQAIQAHLREGVQYRLIETEGLPQGYMAYQLQEGKLFLSKLYLRKGARGQGLARQAVAYLEERCREAGTHVIWLTVNKRNSGSIAAYTALGFRTVDAVVTDIGGGYVMDDYIMEKAVQSAG